MYNLLGKSLASSGSAESRYKRSRCSPKVNTLGKLAGNGFICVWLAYIAILEGCRDRAQLFSRWNTFERDHLRGNNVFLIVEVQGAVDIYFIRYKYTFEFHLLKIPSRTLQKSCQEAISCAFFFFFFFFKRSSLNKISVY